MPKLPTWLGPGKLRQSPRGITPRGAISGTASIVFGASATPPGLSGTATIVFGASANPLSLSSGTGRPPQWVGPGKLRSSPRGLVPPSSYPVYMSGTAAIVFAASATPTKPSSSFKAPRAPSLAAPFNPTQFSPRPPAYNALGPIKGVASIVFGASATPSAAAAGVASIVFGGTSTLTGSGALSGIASIVFDAIGNTTAGPPLSGIADISFDARATPTQPPIVPGTMPIVTNLLLDEATQALIAFGTINPTALGYFGTWPITVIWVPSSLPEDVVIKQNPAPGAPIKVNSPIILWVSIPPVGAVYP